MGKTHLEKSAIIIRGDIINGCSHRKSIERMLDDERYEELAVMREVYKAMGKRWPFRDVWEKWQRARQG